MDALPAAGAGWHVLDVIDGAFAWLDEHPLAAALVFVACILAAGFVEGAAA